MGRVVMIQMNERLTVQHGMKFKRSWHRMVQYTGGYINEKCSHDLDLMCWFKEPEATPVRVVSLGNRGYATSSVGETTCATCTRADCLYRMSRAATTSTSTVRCCWIRPRRASPVHLRERLRHH